MKQQYKSTIAYKIFIFTLIVSIIPMSIMNYIFYRKIEKTVKSEMLSSYRNTVQQYISNIQYKLDLYDYIMKDIAANSMTQKFLSFLQEAENVAEINSIRGTLLEDLNKFLAAKLTIELRDLTLYPIGNKETVYHTHISSLNNDQRAKYLLENDRNSYYICYSDWCDRDVISFYYVIRDISYKPKSKNNNLGLIALNGYARDFFAMDAFSINQVSNIKLFVLDDNKEWIYGTEETIYWNKYKQDVIIALQDNQDELTLEDNRYLLFDDIIPNYDWTVVTLVDYSGINEAIHESLRPILYINIFFYAVLFVACFIFSSSMTKRLKILTKKMAKVESGVMEIHPIIKGKDEIAIIDKNFNDMVIRLTELIEENYIQTIKRKEAQIMALQFQINPHFLYNTLELINSMASYYNCDDIAVVSQKLGQMFRYNMDKNASKYSTIYEEIKHIQNYYIIQKIRFEDKIKLHINVEDEFLQYQTPRFLLQPLVENAFIHGFGKEKTEGDIEISCYYVDDDINIVIEDNGEGMEEERLLYIRKYIGQKAGSIQECNDKERLVNDTMGLGLYNVHSRIKLYYGDNYGLTIESSENIGTKITVHIPKKE